MAHHDHDHGNVSYAGCEVDDATLERLRTTHPTLAENLALARRYGELDDDEKARLVETQAALEGHEGWAPGYHAEGDRCAGCGNEVAPLFTDRFEGDGALAYAPMLLDLPVHDDAACLERLRARVPRPAPQLLDRARRETMQVGGRPSARLAQFFRHDAFAHAPFGLEDWANSVGEANPDMDRAARRDMERLLVWVHERVFH